MLLINLTFSPSWIEAPPVLFCSLGSGLSDTQLGRRGPSARDHGPPCLSRLNRWWHSLDAAPQTLVRHKPVVAEWCWSAFRFSFAQPSKLFSYRRRWMIRTESGRPGWSFWFHLALEPVRILFRHSWWWFVWSAHRNTKSRALLWWGRCRFHEPIWIRVCYRVHLVS